MDKIPRGTEPYIENYDIKCNAAALYGEKFGECLSHKPLSVILARGSVVNLRKAGKI